MIHDIADQNDFNAQLEAAGDKLVLVDFHAAWCAPCKIIEPDFQELSEEFTDVVFLKVDIDEVEVVAEQYNVSSIPKFVFLKNKNQIAEVFGASKERLKDLLLEHK